MSSFDYLQFVQYSNWANERLLQTAAKLPQEKLMEDAKLSYGSAFQTLRHMLDVEWSWRMACEGYDTQRLFWELKSLDDLETLGKAWRDEGQNLLRYVQGLNAEDFDRSPTVTWVEKPFKIGHMIIHIVNHATNHRSELGWYFTRCGYSPGELEFLDYIDPKE
jgi:uncharacterized damage-inducible protein DinB